MAIRRHRTTLHALRLGALLLGIPAVAYAQAMTSQTAPPASALAEAAEALAGKGNDA